MIQIWAFFKGITALLSSIPDIIKLLTALQTAAKKAEVERKTQDDLQALTKAINEKDPAAIQHIFNN